MMLGEVTSGTQQAAIASWEAKNLALIQSIRDKYKTGTFTASQLLPDVEKYQRFAATAKSVNVSSLTPALRAQFQEAWQWLTEVKSYLSANPNTTFDARHVLVRTFVQYAVSSIEAFIEMGRPVLQREVTITRAGETIDRAVQVVTDAPSGLAKWTLESLIQAMGLPKWALPAIGVVAIGGLGLWAYSTFLAPIGNIARASRMRRRRR
mgnify:CR=1 FL=1